MGLLDDAIRQHLELKRRHGADPDEVARQEQEALGAARRAEFAPTPDEDEARLGEHEDELAETEPPVAEVPEPGHETGAPGYDEDPWLEEEPAPPEEGPGAVAASDVQAGQDPGDDVLEETPEFLQETPEHDRLWFEQRPPRDFDWDK